MTPLSVQVDVPEALREALEGGLPRAFVHQAMGRSVANLLMDHFLRKESAGNRRGFPRSHYWARARDSVAVGEVSDERASVLVRHPGVALHLHGGVVRPRQAKSLALPLRPEVYGVNPRENTIVGLFVLKSKKSGKAFLAGKGADGKARLYWILLASARVPADPSTLPSRPELEAAAAKGARSALRAWTSTLGTRAASP